MRCAFRINSFLLPTLTDILDCCIIYHLLTIALHNQRHRSLISSPSDRRSSHGSMPSKTTNSLQPAPQAVGYNLKDHTIQAQLKSSPVDVNTINYSSLLEGYDGFMHSSSTPMCDFKARQNNTLSASSQAALYSRGSALIEATATAEVAAYVCRPCGGTGSDGGIRFDNYNSAFPPIQGNGSSHKSGGSTRGRRTSSDGGERQPPPPSPSGHVTPQNLRDNPERLAKVKTEMCVFYERGGAKNCPYGANCEYSMIFVMRTFKRNIMHDTSHHYSHTYSLPAILPYTFSTTGNYAHGKDELKFRYTTLRLMESSGQITNANTYLARPCMTWVMTGAW